MEAAEAEWQRNQDPIIISRSCPLIVRRPWLAFSRASAYSFLPLSLKCSCSSRARWETIELSSSKRRPSLLLDGALRVMEHDQEMHAHNGDDTYTIYPPALHPYSTSPSSFMMQCGEPRERFLSSGAFGAPHRQDQHEAQHVYDSPQLTLDPSTLDLRSNSNEEPSPSSANTSGSNNTTPTGSLRLAAYNLPNLSPGGVTTRRRARAALEQLQIQIQVGVHSEQQVQSPHQQQQQHQDHQRNQQSDMHDVHMHTGEMQMHIDDRHDHSMTGRGMAHEQGQDDTLSHHVCNSSSFNNSY
jgi:hypothetical protein